MKSQQQNQGSSSQMDQDDMPPIKAGKPKASNDQADTMRQPGLKERNASKETGQKSDWGSTEDENLGTSSSKNR